MLMGIGLVSQHHLPECMDWRCACVARLGNPSFYVDAAGHFAGSKFDDRFGYTCVSCPSSGGP